MKEGNLSMLRQIIVLTISVFATASFAFAQTETARIQGTVTDAAGAAIAGATVTVRSAGTGREVKAVSNDDGTYSLLSLQPGRYEVEVTQANFKTTKQEITLDVAQNASLNFALEPGAVTETVTVTDDIPQVETGTSAI